MPLYPSPTNGLVWGAGLVCPSSPTQAPPLLVFLGSQVCEAPTPLTLPGIACWEGGSVYFVNKRIYPWDP